MGSLRERKESGPKRVFVKNDFEVSYTDSDVNDQKYVLLSGTSGTGKTHILGSFPSPYILNTDRGTKTISHLHIPMYNMTSSNGLYQCILDIISRIEDKAPPFDKLKIKTTCLDDMSRACSLLEMDLIAHPPDGKGRDETLWISDYNLMKNRLITILNRMKALPDMNVVVCSGISSEMDEQAHDIRDHPDVTGRKVGPILPHYFDYVFLTERLRDGTFWVRCRPTSRFRHAKIRIPGGVPSDFPSKIQLTQKDSLFDILCQIDKGTFKYKPEKYVALKDDEEEEDE